MTARTVPARTLIIAGLVAGLFLGGCASAPNPALTAAQNAYNTAAASPDVIRYAPVELHDAKKMLQQAEAAKEDGEVADLSNLVKTRVEIAVATAEKKKADEKKLALEQETQTVLLKSRQIEIDKAKKEADEKARELARKAEEAKAAEIALAVKAKEAEERAKEAATAKEEAEASQRKAAEMKAEAEAATKEMEKLKQQLAELQAKQTERGLVLTLGDVLFSTGKADLMPGAMRSLDKLVAFLQENPERNILIEGHTDSRGTESANLTLSQRRAEAVRTALFGRGIDGGRIATTGYGEAYPIASNDSVAGQQQNRRVEITILEKGVKGENMMRRP